MKRDLIPRDVAAKSATYNALTVAVAKMHDDMPPDAQAQLVAQLYAAALAGVRSDETMTRAEAVQRLDAVVARDPQAFIARMFAS